MSTMTMIGSLIFVIAALFLAMSGLRSHNLPMQTMVRYALIWGVLIVGLVLILGLFVPT
jgi:hypothetical protein